MLRLGLVAVVLGLSCARVTSRSTFPDRSTPNVVKDANSAIELVAQLPDRPGPLEVDPASGRVFFAFHQDQEMSNQSASGCKLCELNKGLEGFQPYPVARPEIQSLLHTPVAIRIAEKRNLMVVLDAGTRSKSPQLLVFHLDNDTLASQFQDFQSHGKLSENKNKKKKKKGSSLFTNFVISRDENFLFLADGGLEPAIVCLKLDANRPVVLVEHQKRVLVHHEATIPKPLPKNFALLGFELAQNHTKYSTLGVKTMEVSADGNFLYIASPFDPYMWVVPTRNIVFGDADEFADILFPKPTSDGIALDVQTNILYLADFEHFSIWMTDPMSPGHARSLVKDQRLLAWPSTLTARRGYLWISCPALYETFGSTLNGKSFFKPPYKIVRIPLMKPVDDDDAADEL